jgi:nicotinamide-nucleotide amidase
MEPEQSLATIRDLCPSLSTAESITCGYLSYLLTSISGASKFFRGGLLLYQNIAKTTFGIKPRTLRDYGAISLEAAKELALSAKKHFATAYSIGIVGNAGPHPDEEKQIGISYLAISSPQAMYEKTIDLSLHQGEWTRNDFRQNTAIEAVIFLANIIQKEN